MELHDEKKLNLFDVANIWHGFFLCKLTQYDLFNKIYFDEGFWTFSNHDNQISPELYSFIIKWLLLGRALYSVLVSVSCPKALFHLESDNLFRITVVVADWLCWNPYHRSSFCNISDWIILKFKLICRWNFLSTLLEWRNRKLIRRYFQRRAFVASK